MKKLAIILALIVFGIILYLIKLPTEIATILGIIGAVCSIIGIITTKNDDEKKNVSPLLILILVLVISSLLTYVFWILPKLDDKPKDKPDTVKPIIPNPNVEKNAHEKDTLYIIISKDNNDKQVQAQQIQPKNSSLTPFPTPKLDNIYYGLEINQSVNVIMSERFTTLAVDGTMSDYIDFDNQGSTLKIGIKKGTYCDDQAVTVMLPNNPNLNNVFCNGNSTFTTENALLAEDISIHLNGNSSFTGSVLHAKTISINANGSSKATINGIVNRLNLSLLGNSNLNAGKLEAASVFVNMVGNSTANVLCCEYIKVEAVGNAELVYGTVSEDCSPSEVFTQIGNSTIRKR